MTKKEIGLKESYLLIQKHGISKSIHMNTTNSKLQSKNIVNQK